MKYLLSTLIVILTLPSYGQRNNSNKDFANDFTKALNRNFKEADLNKLFQKYREILTPHSDVTRLYQQLKEHEHLIFPLNDFKNTKLYIDNINKLLISRNPNQRILAYLVIASSGDTSKENILLEKIKTEHAEGNLIWSGMALLYLHCDRTTPLFDFLVKNEDFGDAHMLPMFVLLNKDSLQQTAYHRINSDNIKANVLAAQLLSVTPANPKTEELLKQAVKNWDINIKGYAIYSIKQLQIGNLLESFKPLVDSSKTRNIVLEALANSPTEADRNYLFELVKKQNDTIPDELLDCFYKSKNIQNIKYWLTLLYTKPISKQYYFSVFQQPLIKTDDVLAELHTALLNVKDPGVLGELVRALAGISDDESINMMINFLSNENSTVRYWTAKTLENNPSPKIRTQQIKELLDKGLKDGN